MNSTIEQVIARASADRVAGIIRPDIEELSRKIEVLHDLVAQMADTIMTAEQVAEALHCSTQTVIKYVKEDGLMGVKRGNAWLFRRSHVIEFSSSPTGKFLSKKLMNRRAS